MKGKQSFKNTEGKCSLRSANDWNSCLLFLSEFDHNRSRWLEKKEEELIIRGSSRYTEAEEMVCQPIKWWKIFRNNSQLQTLQQGSVSPSRALSFSRMRTETITGLLLKIGSIFNCVYAFVSVWRCVKVWGNDYIVPWVWIYRLLWAALCGFEESNLDLWKSSKQS